MNINIRRLEREDSELLSNINKGNIQLDELLTERREQIDNLSNELSKYKHAIDSINSLSGRASMGHDVDCECTYCLIHKIAYEVWRMS